MAEPRSADDLIFHRYEVSPTPDEVDLLHQSGFAGFRHRRDVLKARLVSRVRRGGVHSVDALSACDVGWWLSLLGEAVWECRSRGAWGGAAALAPLVVARDRLAARAMGRLGVAAGALPGRSAPSHAPAHASA